MIEREHVVLRPLEPCFMSSPMLSTRRTGLPIVASKVGAVPEMVKDGLNGYTVEPDDRRSLALALDRLLSDDTVAASFGERSRLVGSHTWERAGAIMGASIREVVGA